MKMLTAKEVAKLKGVRKNSVCAMIRRGRLKAVRVGAKTYLIAEQDAQAYIATPTHGRKGKHKESQGQPKVDVSQAPASTDLCAEMGQSDTCVPSTSRHGSPLGRK